MRVAVIGGGAAGLTAAGSVKNADVVLYEHADKVGKKIYITGKGRCNFTNLCDTQTFLQNVVRSGAFLRSALSVFPPEAAATLLERNGCPTKEERGRRAFPKSDKASDVTKALLRYAECAGAKISLGENITDIIKTDGGFIVESSCGDSIFDRVIICSGGKSYPTTGSDGSMYAVIEKLGHNVVKPVPSLVGLTTKEDLSSAEGLTLKNVTLCADGVKPIFGDLMITADGISGPIALTLSALAARRDKPYKVRIDLKPALTDEELDARILKDFRAALNKQFKNSLDELLPKSIIPIVVARSKVSPEKQVNAVTKQERAALVDSIKRFELTVVGDEGFERAVVTSGGVDVKEVNPKTMESKIVKGLFFGGEVLDVDALTGGYNFHIALATGFVAGTNAGV
ncbi:MAG: NAD(P)/FAD-dependent oxidoreductase [Clostridiales bacterium]|nr:NAD(P)/FAD-dependent oxidoreductase [Clostridiales bacterium]